MQLLIIVLQPSTKLRHLVPVGATASLVHDGATLDDVEALKIGTVCGTAGVGHGVQDQSTARCTLLQYPCGTDTVLQATVLWDGVGRICGDPAVGWVGFLDVYDEKVNVTLVLGDQALKGAHSRHERWSGTAAKIENQWAAPLRVVKDALALETIRPDDLRVRRRATLVGLLEEIQLLAMPHGLERGQGAQTVVV